MFVERVKIQIQNVKFWSVLEDSFDDFKKVNTMDLGSPIKQRYTLLQLTFTWSRSKDDYLFSPYIIILLGTTH